jgi:predicted GNAT family acetyltransferase
LLKICKLLRLMTLKEHSGMPGELRRAGVADCDAVVRLMQGFYAETGEDPKTAAGVVQRRLAKGRYSIWVDSEPVALAAVTTPFYGTVRVQAAYTLPPLRNRGYAAACVGGVVAQLVRGGLICVLITDRTNAISNHLFRRLGFRAVLVTREYGFIGGPPP